MRDHHSHDVLLMCCDCHRSSNLHDLELRRQLARECDAPIGSREDVKFKEDRTLKTVHSAAKALVRNRDLQKIPEQRVEELRNVLKDYYQVTEVSDDVLESGLRLQSRCENCHFHCFARTCHYFTTTLQSLQRILLSSWVKGGRALQENYKHFSARGQMARTFFEDHAAQVSAGVLVSSY